MPDNVHHRRVLTTNSSNPALQTCFKTFVFGIVNGVGSVNLQKISEVNWTIHHSLSICNQSLPPIF